MNAIQQSRILQWTVTIASFVLVARIVDLREMTRVLGSVEVKHVVAALLIALSHFLIGAWRWQKLIILVSGKTTSWKMLFNLYLNSFFVSKLLPGTLTGDGVRIYGTYRHVDGTATATIIVLLERVLGFLFLSAIAITFWLFLPVRPVIMETPPISMQTIFLAAIVLVLIALLAFNNHHEKSKLVGDWIRRLIGTALSIPEMIRKKPYLAIQVMISTLLYQVLSILIVFEALQAANVAIPLILFFAIAPMIRLVLTLPIAINGIGVREYLYLTFLVPYGMSADALLAGLAVSYLIGLPFVIWGWIVFTHGAREFVASHDSL